MTLNGESGITMLPKIYTLSHHNGSMVVVGLNSVLPISEKNNKVVIKTHSKL